MQFCMKVKTLHGPAKGTKPKETVRTRTSVLELFGVMYLFHHLVLLVEELHLDISAHGQRLWKLKEHIFLLSLGVCRVGGVDLHLQLVHHKLRICEKSIATVTAVLGFLLQMNQFILEIQEKRRGNNRKESTRLLTVIIQKRQINSGMLRALF